MFCDCIVSELIWVIELTTMGRQKTPPNVEAVISQPSVGFLPMALFDELMKINEVVVQLRKENYKLKEEVKALKEEKKARLRKEARGTTEKSLIETFPVELLQLIFRFTLPPLCFLDSSLASGPDSPWCRAIANVKSLLLVCSGWYEAGLRVLYRDIVFRRTGQLSQFLHTLRIAPDVSRFIHGITINCYVPAEQAYISQRDIALILEQCPVATSISFTSGYPLPFSPFAKSLPKPKITHLEFSSQQSLSSLAQVLRNSASSLRSLSCQLPTEGVFREISNLRMEELECLRLTMSAQVASKYDIHHKLVLPKLRSLTMTYEMGYNAGRTLPWQSLLPLLKVFGKGLRYLHFHASPWHLMKESGKPLSILLQDCPSIEHLVIHPCMIQNFEHPTLKWIDVWFPPIPEQSGYSEVTQSEINELKDPKRFPQLKSVRVIDPALIFPDLPLALSPAYGTVRPGQFEYCYAGVDVLVDDETIIRNDMSYIDAFTDAICIDDESDGSYICSETASESDFDSDALSETPSDIAEMKTLTPSVRLYLYLLTSFCF